MTADSASDVMSTVVNNSGTLQARTLRKTKKARSSSKAAIKAR